MLPIKITHRAASQIEEAASWWLANRPAAPEAFDEELRIAFHLISRQPEIGARATNSSLAGVRRIQLSTVRYVLYYRVRSAPRQVEVLALWHASRGQGPVV
jgi:plasmid stabilization system protein ParE